MTSIVWTVLMLLTASGLFFNRKIGEFKRNCTRRRREYFLPKIRKLEMFCYATMFSFMALALWAVLNGQADGVIIIWALFAGLALFETIISFFRHRLFLGCLWAVSWVAVCAYIFCKTGWLWIFATILMMICCWIKIWKFYKN